jgi:hypothetical protein
MAAAAKIVELEGVGRRAVYERCLRRWQSITAPPQYGAPGRAFQAGARCGNGYLHYVAV